MPGSKLKADARKLMFENMPRIFIISLIYVLAGTLLAWLIVRLPKSISINMQDINTRLASGEIPGFGIIYTGFRPAGDILALLLFLLQPVIDIGFISYCLKTNRAQKTEFKDLLNGFLFIFKIISIFIITTILVFLWSMLFIIPGIVASYRYRLAYYILLDDPQKSALTCISESKRLMHGRKLDLLIIDFSFLGWYILDFIIAMLTPLPFALPLVSVWLSPYVWLTRAAFYENQITTAAV